MSEKGQVQIVFVGIIFFVVVFGAGWLIGKEFSSDDKDENSKAEIVLLGETQEGKPHEAQTRVDNCRSKVGSQTHEMMEFNYQQILKIDDTEQVDVKIYNAIAVGLKNDVGIQFGQIITTQRTFDFTSPEHQVSIHKIKWVELLQKGEATIGGKTYFFTYPFDITVSQSSENQPCP